MSARTRLPTYSRLQNRPDAKRSGRSAFPDTLGPGVHHHAQSEHAHGAEGQARGPR